jgi:RNA polymerase sigma-70 factor (ECF subfamily)
MNKPDDIDNLLMDGIRRDDYISYNRLFACYYHPLCQFVHGFVSNRNDTEDIVQELFLYLWNNRKKILITDNVSAYLYKMAKNMTLNHIRKETNYKAVLEKQEKEPLYVEEDTLETDEFRKALYDCMNRLPARSKEILLMHRIKGFKQKEIAEKLSISLKTVKNQIWMSLQKLKGCLEHKGV